MNRKVKSILKIAVPFVIIGQLATVIFLLNKDKAFNCRIYDRGSIACREIKL